MDTAQIRADFDRIAETGASHERYRSFLLSQLPKKIDRALEIGCGTGAFTRELAQRSGSVLAIDLSPKMLAAAARAPNIEYVNADINEYSLSDCAFDCVVSIATLHHLPFEPMLSKLGRAMAPGGVLLIHDLFRDSGWGDRLISGVALMARLLERRPPSSAESRAAWAEHGKHDQLMTLSELRARNILPGARFKRHLQWRYSLFWERPRE